MEMEVSETKSETFKKYGRKLTEQEQDWYETYGAITPRELVGYENHNKEEPHDTKE
jgi:hypothetical protein